MVPRSCLEKHLLRPHGLHSWCALQTPPPARLTDGTPRMTPAEHGCCGAGAGAGMVHLRWTLGPVSLGQAGVCPGAC